MNNESSDTLEPYRVMFPLGALVGIIGVSLWILFAGRQIQFLPKQAHGHMMFFAFLWSFVAGFLMTAVPKMTKTRAASSLEIFAVSFSVLLQLVLNVRSMSDFSFYLLGFQNTVLIVFIFRRFLENKVVPFAGFVFLPIAFFQSFLGLYLHSKGEPQELMYLLCGDAFILNLILGLGSRLVPVISRLPNTLMPDQVASRTRWFWPLLVLLLLNFGYLLQICGLAEIGKVLRLVGLAVGAINLMGLFRIPSRWSVSGAGLKLGLVLLILGQVLNLEFFGWQLAGMHLAYVGGFTLITILVSVRVKLAHGQHELSQEISSRNLMLIVASLIISAVLRAFAGADIAGLNILASASFFIFAIALCLRFPKGTAYTTGAAGTKNATGAAGPGPFHETTDINHPHGPILEALTSGRAAKES